jgi:hypothetical protein
MPALLPGVQQIGATRDNTVDAGASEGGLWPKACPGYGAPLDSVDSGASEGGLWPPWEAVTQRRTF